MGERYDHKHDDEYYTSMKSTTDDIPDDNDDNYEWWCVLMCMLPVINMRGVQDIWMGDREEVSHDMTWIPSFAGNFCFTNVCVYTNRNDFPVCFSLFWHRISFIIKECLIFNITLAFLVNPQHNEMLLNGEWTYVLHEQC